MSKPKTVEQWLKEKDLPTELGRVLAPGKHIWEESAMKVEGLCNLKYRCKKCFMRVAESAKAAHENDCRVDPITIDWNTAMEWRDETIMKHGRDMYLNIIRLVVAGDRKQTSSMFAGIVAHAQPKHF